MYTALEIPRIQPALQLPESLQGNVAAEQIYGEFMNMPGDRLERFRSVVAVTPLLYAGTVVPGCEFFIKHEGAQQGGAYKLRGATNKILSVLETNRRVDGIVVASTGNHANETAIAANALGIGYIEGKCPRDTVDVKRTNMERSGLKLDDSYDNLEAALIAARQRGNDPGMLFIHPYDDPAVIAGQGTVGLEVMAQLELQGIDPYDDNNDITLLVTGGGGGLGAGNVVAMASFYPNVHVAIAQMEGGDGIVQTLQGQTVDPEAFDYSCDGAAVPFPGKLALEVLGDSRPKVSVMSVTKGEIGAASEFLAQYHEMPEPAGAAAMALALRLARASSAPTGKRRIFIPVTSGINTTFSKIQEFRRAAFSELSAAYSSRAVRGMAEIAARGQIVDPFRRHGTRVLSSPAR